MLGGVIYELPTLALPTEEKESFLWPTPNLPNGGRVIPERAHWSGMAAYLPSGKKLQVGLESAVRKDWHPLTDEERQKRNERLDPAYLVGLNWPTPVAANGDKETARTRDSLPKAVAAWPTPKASEADHGGPNGRDSSGRASLTAMANWPTPRVSSKRTSRSALTKQHWAAPSLEQAAELAQGLLPREFASMDELSPVAQRMWATPQSRDYRSLDNPNSPRWKRKVQQGWSFNLNDQAANWATPRAHLRDMDTMMRSTLSGTTRRRLEQRGHPYKSPMVGQLNADWVESLMGLPIGWTALDDPQSGPLDQDIPSFHGKHHARLSSSEIGEVVLRRLAMQWYGRLLRQSRRVSIPISKKQIAGNVRRKVNKRKLLT